MRRVALLFVSITLLFACAVPSGTVFALEGAEEAAQTEPIAAGGEAGESAVEEPVTTIEKESVLTATTEDEVIPQAHQPEVVASDTNNAPQLQQALTVPAPDPPIVVEAPAPLPSSPLLITAYQATGAHVHAVQLYNNSSDMVPIDSASLLYTAGGEEYEVPLGSGWIKPRSYIVLGWEGESAYVDITFRFDQVGDGPLETIELLHDGFQPLVVTVPSSYTGNLLHRYKSAAGNYTTNTSFAAGESTVSGGGLYTLPGSPDVSIREIMVNPRDCVVGQESPDCYDYIKLRNDGVEAVDLSLYRLRSGYSNVNSTASNTIYFSDIIASGETVTLTHDRDDKRVSFAANDGTVWFEDIYGYEIYDLGVSPYIDSDLTAQAGRSWAYNDDTETWQWATPAPFEIENNFTPVPDPGKGSNSPEARPLSPCRDDQYRSEETNRCRSIVTASVLKPCSEGQYRSEETNRCRSIASAAASILKPCADDQFRNTVTNRCKKIASSEDIALADCGEGRERNPETNRCRNVLGASTLTANVPFPVEETPEGAEQFTGWWVIGVITALGLSYGIWEWRFELLHTGRRLGAFVAKKK